MDRPGLATVLLPAHGAGDGLLTVVRDLAVAAYALRTRGLALDVLLLDDGRPAAVATAAKAAADLGLPLVTVAGPPSAGIPCTNPLGALPLPPTGVDPCQALSPTDLVNALEGSGIKYLRRCPGSNERGLSEDQLTQGGTIECDPNQVPVGP